MFRRVPQIWYAFSKARHLMSRFLVARLRRAFQVAFFVALGGGASLAADPYKSCSAADDTRILEVCLHGDTDVNPYGHGILGNTAEWTSITIEWTGNRKPFVWHLKDHIFEDVAPRLVDLDKDGRDEIVLVQSSFSKGGRLIVMGTGLRPRMIAATPYIGRRNRWLAPIGIADLDGDGLMELAYIDRPHLAKRLRIWRFARGKLVHAADRDGLTNHKIGENVISGGVRDCGAGPELITADANWQRVMATSFDGNVAKTRAVAGFSVANLKIALGCR
jgi:hypothetical protein